MDLSESYCASRDQHCPADSHGMPLVTSSPLSPGEPLDSNADQNKWNPLLTPQNSWQRDVQPPQTNMV